MRRPGGTRICSWREACSGRRVSLLAVFTCLLLGFSASLASAATIMVTSTNDSGSGSLRQAIAEASPGDTIIVPASASHYAVTSAELVIAKSLTISGAGARSSVIDAMQTKHRVVQITGGTVTLSGVTITGAKEASETGGGIDIEGAANVTLANVSVSGNTVEQIGDGGGIEARSGTTLTISASTIADNVGYNGGGLYLGGTAVITNTTIVGNHGGDRTDNGDGGGLENNGSLSLVNDTIAGNECFNGAGCGGAIIGTATAKNTIVANNVAGNTTNEAVVSDNCNSPLTSSGPNLENGTECEFGAHGGFSNTNPLLGPLANNGGPTETEALFAGSPAIDNGTNEGCPATDQRGGARPQPPGGTCDIGAYEYGSLADVSISQTASPGPAVAGSTLTYQLTAADNGPDPAAGIVVQDSLPAGAALISASPSQGGCVGSAPLVCPLGSLAVGAKATVTVVVRPSQVGVATNTATIGGNPTDPNPENNRSVLQTTVLAPALVVPTIANLAQTHGVWREGNKLAQISRRKKKPPVGTTFSFELNEQAAVTLTFTQRVKGRKVGHRCAAPTKSNKHRKSCKRTVTRAGLSLPGHAGTNKVAFYGRISHGKKLKPGRYTLVLTATNAAGEQSSPKRIVFTIVK